MSQALARWNNLSPEKAAEAILPCCASTAWARGMAARRPIHDEASLLAACDEVWNNLRKADWMEAFRSHPRLGESQPPASASPQSAQWSGPEQHNLRAADKEVQLALAEANRTYEKRFNRIFIACATGKSALEILEILQRRLKNDPKTELHETAEQQRQIAQIRLRKWLFL